MRRPLPPLRQPTSRAALTKVAEEVRNALASSETFELLIAVLLSETPRESLQVLAAEGLYQFAATRTLLCLKGALSCSLTLPSEDRGEHLRDASREDPQPTGLSSRARERERSHSLHTVL